ncbi:MAG: hypothetical protein INR66_06740, partial [Gordonia polyisoprenivorans]|nr:hypothetical protein [Gordonia polyisoprenivorans]
MTSTDTSTGGTAVGEQLLVTITDPGTAYTDDGQVLHADPDQLSAEVLGYAAQVAQTEKVAVPVVIINDAASAQAHVVVYPDGTVDDGSASVAVPQDDPANDAVAYEAPTTPATDAGPELSGEQVPAQPAQAYSDVPGGSSPVAAEQSWQPT